MIIRFGVAIAITSVLLVSACTEESSAPVAQTASSDTSSSTETDPAPETQTETAVEFAALPEPYLQADFDQGRRTYRLCQSCHTLQDGGINLVGPNLYGMFGRQVGAAEGFAYSSALQEADFVWTPERLDEWLANPRTFLPGNRMSFAGVRKEEDRLAVIAYMMSQTGYSASE